MMLKPTDPNGPDRERRLRLGKTMFGVSALVFVLAGLGLYIFSDRLGIAADEAMLLAIAFLFIGGVDYVILRFWDRLFQKAGK